MSSISSSASNRETELRSAALGRELYAQKRWQAAALAFTEAIEADGERPVSWLCIRGACFRQMGQHEQAVLDFSRAAVLDTSRAEVFRARADSLIRLGRLDEAEADLRHVVDLEPSQLLDSGAKVELSLLRRHIAAKELCEQGKRLYRRQQWQGAADCFGRALSDGAAGELAVACHVLRGDCLMELGRDSDAEREHARAVAMSPGTPQLYHVRAVSLWAGGRPGGADGELSSDDSDDDGAPPPAARAATEPTAAARQPVEPTAAHAATDARLREVHEPVWIPPPGSVWAAESLRTGKSPALQRHNVRVLAPGLATTAFWQAEGFD